MKYIALLAGVFSLITNLHAITMTSGLTHELIASHGERLDGNIAILNPKDSTIRVNLEHTDYTFDHTGRNEFPPLGTVKRSNAKWIKLHSPSSFEVGPNGKTNVKFSVDVPKDPKLEGTYWSIVFFEESDLTPIKPQEKQIMVSTKIRYGVQIITHIDNTGEADLKVISQIIDEVDGDKVLKVGVENVGTRSTRPSGALSLYTKMGEKFKDLTCNRANIFPGTSCTFMFKLDEVPSGDYQSLIVLEGKSDDIFGVMKDITIE